MLIGFPGYLLHISFVFSHHFATLSLGCHCEFLILYGINLLSIAFDIYNCVVVFLISIQSALYNFSKKSKVIFKNQFILLSTIYEFHLLYILLPLVLLAIFLFLWLVMFTLMGHVPLHFSKVTVKVFLPIFNWFFSFFHLNLWEFFI